MRPTCFLLVLLAGCAAPASPDCQTLAMTPPEVLAESAEARRGILAADCGDHSTTYEVRRLPGPGQRFELRTVD